MYFLLVRNLSNQNQYFLFFFFLPLPSRYTFAVTVHRLFKGDHYHHWILFLYHADTLKTKIKRETGKKKTILEMRKAKNALLLKLASLLFFFFGTFGAFL